MISFQIIALSFIWVAILAAYIYRVMPYDDLKARVLAHAYIAISPIIVFISVSAFYVIEGRIFSFQFLVMSVVLPAVGMLVLIPSMLMMELSVRDLFNFPYTRMTIVVLFNVWACRVDMLLMFFTGKGWRISDSRAEKWEAVCRRAEELGCGNLRY
ncbi:hypothetical protein MHT86_10060 [Corynebacterium mastitidis]|uniref:hypothetical protein n=1 Tax=Corynebacterium mastitidis TaxID=161890 RepID=UPI0012FED50D|nr:hypothetical protein [Corynebacterium mastitidis]MCH6197828.1 hypothetical protein [Corynebacterium mastitidis]